MAARASITSSARTIKDLICRFRAMQGRQVTRIAGWDTHGLPVEIEVEKQLKLNGKKAIEEFGVEKFNALCRQSVFTYKADWEQLSDRIGYWLDYEHPYVTYTNEYVESVWWLLDRLFEKGLLYRGHRVLPYCPRCGTVLSSHELSLGYEEVQGPVDLRHLSARPMAAAGSWWSGPRRPGPCRRNVAAAVHPEMEYVDAPRAQRRMASGAVLVVASARATALAVDRRSPRS